MCRLPNFLFYLIWQRQIPNGCRMSHGIYKYRIASFFDFINQLAAIFNFSKLKANFKADLNIIDRGQWRTFIGVQLKMIVKFIENANNFILPVDRQRVPPLSYSIFRIWSIQLATPNHATAMARLFYKQFLSLYFHTKYSGNGYSKCEIWHQHSTHSKLLGRRVCYRIE